MRRLEIRLLAPTHVAAGRRPDHLRMTAPNLPGWVIRGALAAAWLSRHDQQTELPEFLQLFEGGVRFGPAFLAGPPQSRALLSHKYPPLPGGCPAGPIDRALGDPGLWHARYCPVCAEPLEESSGYAPQQQPRIHRRTSTAVGDDGVAEPGNLYSRDSLRRNQTFVGEVIATRGELLDRLPQGGITIGGRRTTHGRSEVGLLPPDGSDTGHPVVTHDNRLILRLTSPAVFVDDKGRPASTPNLTGLSEVLEVEAISFAARWVRWELVSGWHAASRLPKHTEYAIAAGSTYVINLGAQPNAAALQALADRGVGIRRHEGFGHLWRESHHRAVQEMNEAQRALHDSFRRDWKLLTRHRSQEALDLIRNFAAGTTTATQLAARAASAGGVVGRALRLTSDIPATDVAALLLTLEQP